MSSQQFDAGREGARRLHRVLSLYCALFCWKRNVDAVILPKSELYKILGVTKIMAARREWLEEDIKDYFSYYFDLNFNGIEYFAFSRVSKDNLKLSNSYKFMENNLNVINQLDAENLFASEEERAPYQRLLNNFPFLNGTTSSTSHLMGILMSSLASGVISVNDIF